MRQAGNAIGERALIIFVQFVELEFGANGVHEGVGIEPDEVIELGKAIFEIERRVVAAGWGLAEGIEHGKNLGADGLIIFYMFAEEVIDLVERRAERQQAS